MGLLQRLEMRQGQSLVMTPQLLQAIKLLQLSHLDLVSYVDAELERNPLLESVTGDAAEATASAAGETAATEPFDGAPDGWESRDAVTPAGEIGHDLDPSMSDVYPDEDLGRRQASAGEDLTVSTPAWQSSGGSFEGSDFDAMAGLTAEPTLHEHLTAQLDLTPTSPVERLVGAHIIDAVNEAGYLGEPLAVIADRLGVSVEQAEAVLALVQGFTPTGVAARDLAECLRIQLAERDRLDPAMVALVERLDLVARRDTASLKRICGVDDEDLADMLAELRQLDPKPGRAFGSGPVHVLVPDVFVRALPDGSWHIELNPDTLPRVLVNQDYHARVSKTCKSDAEKSFVSECLQSANWLTRSLEQRSKTILKVASEIVRQQDGFFVNGVTHLRPLNLKTVADAIGIHESTVSRVTSNKAIGTARGTFEMKYFFTASIPGAGGSEAHSSEAVRYRIRQLVDGEVASDVLSDDALVKKLRVEGIDIARRTVAKYRESLRIPSSVDRRREKAMAR